MLLFAADVLYRQWKRWVTVFKAAVTRWIVSEFNNLEEEPYPQISPNGEWLSLNLKNQKSKILESKMNFPPKIKFGGYG